MSEGNRTNFECASPILRIENMAAAVQYYVDVLAFENASWGNQDFTSVNRGRAGIYLGRGDQGPRGRRLGGCRGRTNVARGAEIQWA